MVASIGRTVMHHVPRAVVPWVLLEVYHTLANDAHFTVVMSDESIPTTMPTSTPCPAARRGVRVADGPKYPHIHSEWNHPSMSSQCMGRGL